MNNKTEDFIRSRVVEFCGGHYEKLQLQRSGLGCINETWQAHGEGLEPLFIKVGAASAADMYEQEIKGLKLLEQAQRFRVPKAHFVAANDNVACLVMEFIDLGPVRGGSEKAVGEALAELHSFTNDQFGLAEDNYIGRSPQVNGFADNWWAFFCERRLTVQMEMAKDNNMRDQLVDRIQRLIDTVPAAFGEHAPAASLLHGDLWSGNMSVDENGKPAIYDPAVYYGDAETDIAMSKMFQSLGDRVYEVYHSHHPRREGMETRRNLYDLYHWLNHFNLFGVTYLGQVEQCVDAVLAETD
ncbi:MAG: fructosamine kinase family protein [Ketobacteraceae bacterium]|nr:fructosamine kinase family protein [Ketobacteraceae bacterium]